jgi:hypothetical protein
LQPYRPYEDFVAKFDEDFLDGFCRIEKAGCSIDITPPRHG